MNHVSSLYYILAFSAFLSFESHIFAHAFPTLFSGTIYIEKDKKVCTKHSTDDITEPICVYYLGKCIKTTVQVDNPGVITFDVPREDIRFPYQCTLVITEKREWVASKKHSLLEFNNTIDHWRVSPGYTAHFYDLTLLQIKPDASDKKQPAPEPEYEWVCKKRDMPSDGRIPDDALVVIYNPDLVKELRGGDQIQLPTIVIKQCDDQNLKDLHLRLQIESLDARAFHAPDKQVMHHHKDKESTLLILPAT